MTSPIDRMIEPYIDTVQKMKAYDVVALDVRELTSIADAFIICEGKSNRQVSAIGDRIIHALKKIGIRPISVEGLAEGRWVLIDYGDVIIHVFYESVRKFYDIEGLWVDARRINPVLSQDA
ncbi:MAG: ribosome silencing factor [Desulfococcus sp. 4484_241]|nr:MAG: ribosome silencing factor [Desulfococcus sp. 4484_241]